MQKPVLKSTLKVRKSKIHGKGLFALTTVAEGVLLGVCKSKPVKADGPYVLTLTNGKKVRVTCKFKYINHSAKPNVAYHDDMTVVALRRIAAGEELTHDYGEEWH